MRYPVIFLTRLNFYLFCIPADWNWIVTWGWKAFSDSDAPLSLLERTFWESGGSTPHVDKDKVFQLCRGAKREKTPSSLWSPFIFIRLLVSCRFQWLFPVPKIKAVKSLNDYSSQSFCVCAIQVELNPVQFAHSVILDCLGGGTNFIWLLFIDSFSAFNRIKSHILTDRLSTLHNADSKLKCRLADF